MRDLALWELLGSLERDRMPHVLATVVKVIGSASAKAGSKALISQSGKNLFGWVGGGCAEAYVIQQSLEALEEGTTRTIIADLDDEVFGLGMPCGGKMEIFLEPRLPAELLSFSFRASPKHEQILKHLGFVGKFGAQTAPDSLEELLVITAQSLASARGLSFETILAKRKMPLAQQNSIPFPLPEFLILGHSRITEELATLSALLSWKTKIYGLNLDPTHYPATTQAMPAQPEYAGLEVVPGSAVLVASHHKGDAHFLHAALKAQASYIGMIASEKRARIVYEHLSAKGINQDSLAIVRSPAGIDLQCKNPAEIALSVVVEIILGKKN